MLVHRPKPPRRERWWRRDGGLCYAGTGGDLPPVASWGPQGSERHKESNYRIMSAFIVSNFHVATIVNYGTCQKRDIGYIWCNKWKLLADENPNWIGQVLVDENQRAVNARYGEDLLPEQYQPVSTTLTSCNPMEILKAVHCLQYQCNETVEWPQSEAYAILKAIESYAVRALPGYDEAPWTITE